MQNPCPIDVLMVEDDNTYRLLVEKTLENNGMSVRLATNLAEAIKLLEEKIPDVILLDLTLPDSVGLDTLRAVGGKSKSAQVLVLTGITDMDMAMEAVEMGAQDWIIKGQTDDHLTCDILFSVARCKRCFDRRKALEQRILSAFTGICPVKP